MSGLTWSLVHCCVRQAGWPERHQGFCCLCLPSCHRNHTCAIVSVWLSAGPRIQTGVSTLTQQVLWPLSHLPSQQAPSCSIHPGLTDLQQDVPAFYARYKSLCTASSLPVPYPLDAGKMLLDIQVTTKCLEAFADIPFREGYVHREIRITSLKHSRLCRRH